MFLNLAKPATDRQSHDPSDTAYFGGILPAYLLALKQERKHMCTAHK